jgi:hypothetical protein
MHLHAPETLAQRIRFHEAPPPITADPQQDRLLRPDFTLEHRASRATGVSAKVSHSVRSEV